jgi:NADH:ubiquinone oxidoreductase subunit B-like Fe-S oxidoreductase
VGLLIPCSKELVGSNPTPRAYLGGLYKRHKNKVSKDSSKRKTDLTYRQLLSKQEEEEKEKENEET